MKTYIHARVTGKDRAMIDGLRRATGWSGSELVRHGLRLAYQELGPERNALDLAGGSVGKFKNGPRDLSTAKKHLDGFGR